MKKILIVEDDFYIRDLYQMAFTKAGYTVAIAVDGQEALDIIKTNNYDMILLDIMMPKVTGIDVLRSFRGEGSLVKDTPIFLITNLGQENIIKEAFKIGADGYFLKSQLTPQEIVKEINIFLEEQEKVVKVTQTASSTTPSTQQPTQVPNGENTTEEHKEG